MPKKKKKKSKPKPRHAWEINPKTRVKSSGKTYARKKKDKDWFEEIFDAD